LDDQIKERWARHIEEARNPYMSLVRKPEGKTPLRRLGIILK
jgi:hypothetical protein